MCLEMNISAFHKNTFRIRWKWWQTERQIWCSFDWKILQPVVLLDIYDLLVDYDVTIVAEHVIKVETGSAWTSGNKVRRYQNGIFSSTRSDAEQSL